MSLNDLQLAKRARHDPEATEQMLRRLYPKVFQMAHFAAGKRRQAEDIAQIAAMEVVKSIDNYNGTGSLEAWAGQITYRVAMRHLKKTHQTETMYVPLVDERLTSPDNPEQTVSRRHLFEVLLKEMEQIPAARRISLLLHLVYGHTVNEVAKMTDVSPNTVKDRLKTAYRELRSIFDEHPGLRTAMLEELQ